MKAILPVLTKAIATLKINPAKSRAAIDPSLYATDLADVLVKAGVPFRDAHALVGKAVKLCIESDREINQLTKEEWQISISGFDFDFSTTFSPEVSIETRSVPGGTASQAVLDQINTARKCLIS